MFMCSIEKEKKTHNSIYKFIPLHADLCIVDEFPVNTDECKDENPSGKSWKMIFLLALFTMYILLRTIDTISTTKFTINH